jgi:RNA polymerase sigma factor (sigma-70 family)
MVDDQGSSDSVLQALLKNRMASILYEMYAGDIYSSVVHKLGKNHPDVEDCVQETFKNAYRSLKSRSDDELSNLVRDDGLIKWLHGIANHVVPQVLKKNSHVIKRSPPKDSKNVSDKQGQLADEEGTVVAFVLMYLSQPEGDLAHRIEDENARDPENIVIDSENDAETYQQDKDRYEIVRCAIEALPKMYSTTLSLRYLAGDKLSPEEEIAKEMGVSVGVVKARISRALEKIRHYVDIRQYLAEMDKSQVEKNVSLPAVNRKVMVLHFYECLEWNHIAMQCDCTEDEDRAKKVLHRGIEILLQSLERKSDSKQ